MHFEEDWQKAWRKDQDNHSRRNPTVVQTFPLDRKRPRIPKESRRRVETTQ